MIEACFVSFSVETEKVMMSFISILLSVAAVIALRKLNTSIKTTVSLIYVHLSGLFFPFVLMTTNYACGLLCLPCYDSPLGLALLSLPTTLVMSAAAGFFVVPAYYMFSKRSFLWKDKTINAILKRHSLKLGIKTPSIYILNMAKPVAFSFKTFKSAVFLSVGLLDILKRKEIEAVILHELYHIKSSASVFKLSASLMKLSPFSVIKNFNRELEEEEKKADMFASEIQGTFQYITSAKKKIKRWESE